MQVQNGYCLCDLSSLQRSSRTRETNSDQEVNDFKDWKILHRIDLLRNLLKGLGMSLEARRRYFNEDVCSLRAHHFHYIFSKVQIDYQLWLTYIGVTDDFWFISFIFCISFQLFKYITKYFLKEYFLNRQLLDINIRN